MTRPHEEFPLDVSFQEAGRRALTEHISLLADSIPGVIAGDADAVHDIRVASRRLRAALAVFAKLFPGEERRELERQAARVTGALGAVRDLDVMILALRAEKEGLSREAAYGIERAIQRLVRRRSKERRALKKVLDDLAKGKLEKRLRLTLEALN